VIYIPLYENAAIVEYSEVPELQITVVAELLAKCW